MVKVRQMDKGDRSTDGRIERWVRWIERWVVKVRQKDKVIG